MIVLPKPYPYMQQQKTQKKICFLLHSIAASKQTVFWTILSVSLFYKMLSSFQTELLTTKISLFTLYFQLPCWTRYYHGLLVTCRGLYNKISCHVFPDWKFFIFLRKSGIAEPSIGWWVKELLFTMINTAGRNER